MNKSLIVICWHLKKKHQMRRLNTKLRQRYVQKFVVVIGDFNINVCEILCTVYGGGCKRGKCINGVVYTNRVMEILCARGGKF